MMINYDDITKENIKGQIVQIGHKFLIICILGPTPNPKCKLITSTFLTPPHLLDCLICTKNAMSIVLLLGMMGGWDRWGVVDLYQCVGEGTWSRYHLIVFVFVFCFCILLPDFLSPFILVARA